MRNETAGCLQPPDYSWKLRFGRVTPNAAQHENKNKNHFFRAGSQPTREAAAEILRQSKNETTQLEHRTQVSMGTLIHFYLF